MGAAHRTRVHDVDRDGLMSLLQMFEVANDMSSVDFLSAYRTGKVEHTAAAARWSALLLLADVAVPEVGRSPTAFTSDALRLTLV